MRYRGISPATGVLVFLFGSAAVAAPAMLSPNASAHLTNSTCSSSTSILGPIPTANGPASAISSVPFNRTHSTLDITNTTSAILDSASAAPAPTNLNSDHPLNATHPTPYHNDFSYIKNFAAVGDSYAAGVGAGKKDNIFKFYKGAWYCSRYDHGYPQLIQDDIRLGAPRGRNFNFEACTGAKGEDILKQVNALEDGQTDLMTITGGGNDVGFANVIRSCVVDGDWQNCHFHLDAETEWKITHEVADNLDRILALAKFKINPDHGRIYLTGYPKFWNADTTGCNSWNFAHKGRKKIYLDQELRRKSNALTDKLNEQIRLAAERAGPKIIFVNMDEFFTKCSGLFCEKGADNQKQNAKSDTLLFFVDGNKDQKFDQNERNNRFASLQKREKGMLSKAWGYTTWMLTPDNRIRMFHPRSQGHGIIADLVIWHMQVENAKMRGVEPPRKPGVEVCPAKNQEVAQRFD